MFVFVVVLGLASLVVVVVFGCVVRCFSLLFVVRCLCVVCC